MKISQITSILNVLKDLCVIRQKSKTEKHFSKYCLECFSGERVLIEDKWQTDCKIKKWFN